MPSMVKNGGIQGYSVYINSGKEQSIRMLFDCTNWKLNVVDSNGLPVSCTLGNSEVRVLYQLISQSGEVFSKEQLVLFGWPGRVVTFGSLTQAIFNIRSCFGAEGHSVIVTSPKAGYMFNTNFLAVTEYEEGLQENVIDMVTGAALAKPVVKNKVVKKAFGKLMLGVGCVFFMIGIVYSVMPEIEIMEKDHLKVSHYFVGRLEIDFITSVKKNVEAHLLEQVKDISPTFPGKVLVRVHDKRYRVVCYTSVGSSSYAVPINVPLNLTVARCKSRIEGVDLEY
ncbi:hypothetical protein PkoCFBP13504_20775 [Pseudomonas koreensis]|uniref:winged helix-turn-helix domain-containing protein n=1 Tax=Pseudomonas koreensis TaxID=198620 RepID=UPI0010BF983F|nr:winged helix-turn-helix domain-containing protein [Pseudomonas koreensis]TKJ79217.1 hypothetical protein PkoCFBP13504_20775 [Pseudomonas koreensis]